MRKHLMGFTAALGLAVLPMLLGTGSASAATAPAGRIALPLSAAAIQQADWYCDARCEYWRHRRWERHHRWEERRRWEEGERWRERHYGYNGWYR